MGTIIDPIAIKAQSDGMVRNFKARNDTLTGILPTITNFESEPELSGGAWTGLKNQIGGHRSIVRGLICANESVISDSEALVLAVGHEYLDEDKILAEIERLRAQNNCYNGLNQLYMRLQISQKSQPLFKSLEGMLTYNNHYCMNYISGNGQAIAHLQQKLSKITQILCATASLYTNSDMLFGYVRTGIAELEKGGSGSSFTGIKSGSWQAALDKSWKKREDAKEGYEVYFPWIIGDILPNGPQIERGKDTRLYTTIRGSGMAIVGRASQIVTLKKGQRYI